uniref:Uncharacterized protein n=2 Tax=Arundo donax TaxID=35708 RepID=A0A0A9F4F3_ARUDO
MRRTVFMLVGGPPLHSNIQARGSLPYNNNGRRALYLLPELVADLNLRSRLLKLELLYLFPILVNNITRNLILVFQIRQDICD